MSIEMETTQDTENANINVLFSTITFGINDKTYALNILNIRDIIMGKKIYRIPNSDPILMGVTNIRGEILPVYSLKNILGLDESMSTEKHPILINCQDDEYLIIIKYDSYLFAINVDYIDKNIGVTTENYNPVDYMSDWTENPIFSGIIIDEKDNILIIDVPSLIDVLIKNLIK